MIPAASESHGGDPRRHAGRRLLLLAITAALLAAAAAGPVEGHLAAQTENSGNGFSAAADFTNPEAGG